MAGGMSMSMSGSFQQGGGGSRQDQNQRRQEYYRRDRYPPNYMAVTVTATFESPGHPAHHLLGLGAADRSGGGGGGGDPGLGGAGGGGEGTNTTSGDGGGGGGGGTIMDRVSSAVSVLNLTSSPSNLVVSQHQQGGGMRTSEADVSASGVGGPPPHLRQLYASPSLGLSPVNLFSAADANAVPRGQQRQKQQPGPRTALASTPDVAAGGVGGTDAQHRHPAISDRHRQFGDDDQYYQDEEDSWGVVSVTPTWRLKERMKTVGVCLVLALNIGTDPPDVHRPTPCAKLQTWFDPTVVSRAKAREKIGERLEGQYARWQQRAKLRYRRALDPTTDDVRSLCLTMRRAAKNERLLLHYNGHGVPKPTINGEIWLFDKNHTQYIPLQVSDLKGWLGRPSIVVLDCSGAGVLLPFFLHGNDEEGDDGGGDNDNEEGNPQAGQQPSSSSPSSPSPPRNDDYLSWASRTVRDFIVLCPCSAEQNLPMNPDYPADVFTSCLTTPIPIALRWFVRRNPLSSVGCCVGGDGCLGGGAGGGGGRNLFGGGVTLEDAENAIDRIPGRLNDRKTPLGELNWIFTAVTDTIAWNVLPSPLFQRLFRQDLLVASMFRNFLLADRILRSLHCTPSSIPALPPTSGHPLWEAWDLAVETCLYQLLRGGHLGKATWGPCPPGPTGGARQQQPTAPTGGVAGDGGVADGGTTTTNGAERGGGGAEGAQRAQDPGPNGAGGGTAEGGPRDDAAAGATQQQQQSQPSTATPPTTTNVSSPFFSEQLDAFEIWLEYAGGKYGDRYGIADPRGGGGGQRHRRSSLDYYAEFYDYDHDDYHYERETESPEQLPVVLQVLLSQAHRVRALALLRRFLDLGPHAVNLALSVGIFPYVLKLLQSPIDEYRTILVGIWAKILSFDPSCQADLVKDGALPHFIAHLRWGLPPRQQRGGGGVGGGGMASVVSPSSGGPRPAPTGPAGRSSGDVAAAAAEQRTMAAFIISAICHEYPAGQAECLRQNLHGSCSVLLLSMEGGGGRVCDDGGGIDGGVAAGVGARAGAGAGGDAATSEDDVSSSSIVMPSQFRMWLCICVGNLCRENVACQRECYGAGLHDRLIARLTDDDCPEVRAAAAYAVGMMIGSSSSSSSGSTPESSDDAVAGAVPTGGGVDVTGGAGTPRGAAGVGVGAGGLASPTLGGVHVPPPSMPPQMSVDIQRGSNMNVPWQQMQLQPSPRHRQRQQQQHGNLNGAGDAAGMGGYVGAMVPPSPSHREQQAAQSTSPMTGGGRSEDRSRLSLDLASAGGLVAAFADASPMVRYEAALAFGCLVGKYLTAFASVANDHIVSSASAAALDGTNDHHPVGGDGGGGVDRGTSSSTDNNGLTKIEELSLPAFSYNECADGTATTRGVVNMSSPARTAAGLSRGEEGAGTTDFRSVWTFLRALQHRDPFKAVAEVANSIVSVVHEHMLITSSGGLEAATGAAAAPISDHHQPSRTRSMISIDRMMPSATNRNDVDRDDSSAAADGVGSSSEHGMRRNISDISAHIQDQRHGGGVGSVKGGGDVIPKGPPKVHYTLPTSKYYSWKRTEFGRIGSGGGGAELQDPLSLSGRIRAYRDGRNARIVDQGRALASRFEALVPKPPRDLGKKTSSPTFMSPLTEADLLAEIDDDESSSAAIASAEAEIGAKKRMLQMRQTTLIHNDDVKLTSMMRFHPYEPALIVCDGFDGVSVWDVDKSSVSNSFRNGNPKGSRMTSVTWINEESSSLLLTGCDDGVVRIWDGLIEPNGEIGTEKPTLSSAFFAAPDLVAGQRGGSGLVTEWQQFNGNLIAGGNSTVIRCWDLEAEKCSTVLERKSDACVTTITSAWDGRSIEKSSGTSGIGPDIIVAGYGDGSMRVFDIRDRRRCPVNEFSNEKKGSTDISESGNRTGREMNMSKGGFHGRGRRKDRLMHYTEHTSWIVDTFFTSFGGRYEVISGGVAGIVKFWDLRLSTSTRTLDVQRSPMTTMAVHSRVPLLATGSPAQFIKILMLDGDALQTIRYHEKITGQRVGPVSSLSFHPNKMILAATFTDEFISFYSPRDTSR